MDLESASRELYAGSPDDFVQRRQELVGLARAAKDRPLATAISKLRRPTRSAWLVNLYAREAATELGDLLDLGAALQAAQQQLSGPDLRRLSADRSRALAAATRRAVAIGRDHGYDAPEAARTEVTQTLQAALADPEVAAQIRLGTLSQAQSYGGFGFPLTDAPAPNAADQAVEPDAAAGSEHADEGDAEEEEEAAAQRAAEEQRRVRAEAEARLEDAESALAAADEEAQAATERADELAEAVERLRTELAAADEGETAAREEARAARKRVSEQQTAVREARAALEAL